MIDNEHTLRIAATEALRDALEVHPDFLSLPHKFCFKNFDCSYGNIAISGPRYHPDDQMINGIVLSTYNSERCNVMTHFVPKIEPRLYDFDASKRPWTHVATGNVPASLAKRVDKVRRFEYADPAFPENVILCASDYLGEWLCWWDSFRGEFGDPPYDF